MKKHPVPLRDLALRVCLCALLGLGLSNARAADNFLKTRHEQLLERARVAVKMAASAAERALALRRAAVELDALGMPDAALRMIDTALAEAGAPDIERLQATKARILFSLGRPEETLQLLEPQMEQLRRLAGRAGPVPQTAAAPDGPSQVFLTAIFAYMQMKSWRKAIAALADMPPTADEGLAAYRSVIYCYIMARAGSRTLANAALEKDAAYYAAHDKSGYGFLLRLWKGSDISSEVGKFIGEIDNAEQQEMMGKILFYLGVYLRYARGNVEAGRSMLQSLGNVAPYGSIEWAYGKTVLR